MKGFAAITSASRDFGSVAADCTSWYQGDPREVQFRPKNCSTLMPRHSALYIVPVKKKVRRVLSLLM